MAPQNELPSAANGRGIAAFRHRIQKMEFSAFLQNLPLADASQTQGIDEKAPKYRFAIAQRHNRPPPRNDRPLPEQSAKYPRRTDCPAHAPEHNHIFYSSVAIIKCRIFTWWDKQRLRIHQRMSSTHLTLADK